ncbi:MAG: hypothetical protein H0W99_10890 [Acidobacteria bacterium]|nr:hypothetical protein [Acidobacteriota bacterium]
MKYFIVIIGAILFFAGVSFAQPKYSDARCKGLSKKIAVLISEYQELRNKRRQLRPGSYDKDVSGFGGRLHEVLSSLGAELGHPPYTKKIVVGCVGEPDAIRSNKQMSNYLEIYNRESRQAGRKVEEKRNREYLIYFWRGWHDFIFFIVEEGVIVDHDWWFAYE